MGEAPSTSPNGCDPTPPARTTAFKSAVLFTLPHFGRARTELPRPPPEAVHSQPVLVVFASLIPETLHRAVSAKRGLSPGVVPDSAHTRGPGERYEGAISHLGCDRQTSWSGGPELLRPGHSGARFPPSPGSARFLDATSCCYKPIRPVKAQGTDFLATLSEPVIWPRRSPSRDRLRPAFERSFRANWTGDGWRGDISPPLQGKLGLGSPLIGADSNGIYQDYSAGLVLLGTGIEPA